MNISGGGQRMPIMTRRGLVYCDVTPEGHVTLPEWVESTDLFRDGNCQVRVDVSQNSGYTIIASIDKKGHVQLPKGYCIAPHNYNSAGEPHDLDLIVTDMNATPRPIIKCKGGIDARPGLEEMARLIRENEQLTAKMAELITERDNMRKARDASEILRTRSLELNTEYARKLGVLQSRLRDITKDL